MEHVTRHGNFRVVATAEKVDARLPGEPRWKVLVSLWRMEVTAANETPEMIRLEDRRSGDLDEALSGAVAVAVRRISERKG
jgi:hypothetical protein